MSGWILPLFFILVAFFFGFILTYLFRLSFGRFERAAIAGPLGLVALTEINLLLALIFGLNRFSIISSIVIALSLTICIFIYFSRGKSFKKDSVKDSLKSWPFWLVFMTFGLYVIGVLFAKVLNADGNGNLLIGPPALYGDTALHASYISKTVFGPFPPENPLFAGIKLTYPYMNNFLSAILIVLGLNLRYGLIIPQIFFLIGFMVLFIKLAKKFNNNLGAFIAPTIWFLGWGLGFIFFLKEWSMGVSFSEYVQRVGDFTHNDKYYLNLHNVITGMILPERTFLPGLFLGALIANVFASKENLNFKSLLLASLILGILPLWHSHTFLFFSIATFCWIFLWLEDKFSTKIKMALFFFFLAGLLALPIVIQSLNQISARHFLTFLSGWMRGEENIFIYWFKNSFLLIPIAVLGYFVLLRNLRSFFVPSFFVFLLANIISFQPWVWDNIKLLAWALLFFSILCAQFYCWMIKKGKIFIEIAAIVIIISCLSGFLALGTQLQPSYVIYDKADIDLAEWVKINTNPDDIFLMETFHNNPVPGLAGRSIYLGYPGFLWVHGIDYRSREVENSKILKGDLRNISQLEVPIDYIAIDKKGGSPNFGVLSVDYQNEKYVIYKVR